MSAAFPEPSLGEILGAALSGCSVAPAIDSARYASALELATLVADRSALSFSEAWDALTFVPDNMLSLLDSPQGWSSLASWIAADCGVTINLKPTLH